MTPSTTSPTHPGTPAAAAGDLVDIAVVGGGLAGLAAATMCARAGARVVVFDARDTLGGRARSAADSGYRLNEGAHALYLEGEARRVLASLGLDPVGGSPPSGGTILDGGATHTLPVTPLALARTSLFTMADRVSAGRLLAGLGRVEARALDGVTVTEWLAGATRRARVRGLVTALVRLSTYCDDPDHLSAGAAVDQLRLAQGGVRYVDGGWQTMVDALAADLVAHGGRIEAGAKVTAIEPRGAAGPVVHHGSSTPARAVVLAAGGPEATRRLLAGTGVGARWPAARPAIVSTLDVGLSGAWTAAPFGLGLDRPLYLSVHAPVAALAPPGATLVSTISYRPTDRAEHESLLDRFDPSWRSRAVVERYGARRVAATDVPTASGGGRAGRPDPVLDARAGLYAAGDWVGPEGLLADAALASARSAASAALDRWARVGS